MSETADRMDLSSFRDSVMVKKATLAALWACRTVDDVAALMRAHDCRGPRDHCLFWPTSLYLHKCGIRGVSAGSHSYVEKPGESPKLFPDCIVKFAKALDRGDYADLDVSLQEVHRG
jgi:hypothetical protein